MDFRGGDWNSARDLVSRISYNNVQNNAKILMQLAHIRSALGMPDVLKFAYQARRKAPMDANTQIGYFNAFVAREQAQDVVLDANEVAIDTAVRLRCGTQESVLIIVADDMDNLLPDEVPISHATAQLLLGHRAGDSIQLNDRPFRHRSVSSH